MRRRADHHPVPATNSDPRPADFPLGSVDSRAAVRAMIDRRAAQHEKQADIYRASWVGHPQDEVFEILDLNTGLPATRGNMTSGGRSEAIVQLDEEVRDAPETHDAQAGKGKVAQRKKDVEFEILDL